LLGQLLCEWLLVPPAPPLLGELNGCELSVGAVRQALGRYQLAPPGAVRPPLL